MKNYYEILQVNKNASPEVIEKVYKMLVKEYHPDLHPEGRKQFAEEQIKLINEAYDILSNKEKRKNYDKSLEENFVDIEKYNLIINENIKLKNELNDIKLKINNYNNYYNNNLKNNFNNYSNNNYNNLNYDFNNINNNVNNNVNYNTNNNYKYNSEKNNNYYYDEKNQNSINYKNNINNNYYNNFNLKNKLKNLLKNILALFMTFVFILIIFQIPFLKNIIFNLGFESGLFIIPIVAIIIYLMGKK